MMEAYGNVETPIDLGAQETLRQIVSAQLALLAPVKPSPTRTNGKYGAAAHATIVRMKILGLSDAVAARAAGVSPTTLANWLRKHPQLADDIEQAKALGLANAAALLQILMTRDNPTAFHALKLFLETHAPEFQKTTRIAVEHDLKGVVRQIRSNIYGLPPNDADDEPPLLEVEADECEDVAAEEAESGDEPW